MSSSAVWLNGFYLGSSASGYTPSRYSLTAAQVNWDADNLLAIYANGSNPDGWWYDGGGLYRHVWVTAITTPAPYLAGRGAEGVYAPSSVVGPIKWVAGAPFADAQVLPSVYVNSAGSSDSFPFTVSLAVLDLTTGAVVGTGGGSGSVPGNGGTTVWRPASPIAVPGAALWHLVAPPLKPALYRLSTTLTVAGVQVDVSNVTFGIRTATFNPATGFSLNGIITKINGAANHQDFAAVGVAVPDHLQWHRVAKLKEAGLNGWRTAHNAPTPALLDAADELGMVVWDENHRNGQDDQVPLLVLRDRNHPSVVIWSICNEILCDTHDAAGDAIRLKGIFHELDPLGGRPVSANSRDGQPLHIDNRNPLDLIGMDYSTNLYDGYKKLLPDRTFISSESSSQYGDRHEYIDNSTAGHVGAFNEDPSWGETAEDAWGGIGDPAGQGILTRDWVAGGFTWTGWDYRGEPTPDGWPNTNSHFGMLDLAGFPKDRFHAYASWYIPPATGNVLHIMPHWTWDDTFALPIWVFSNGDEVELFVNGVSAGRKAVVRYSHAAWTGVRYAPGSLTAVAYLNGTRCGSPMVVNTTGPAAALRLSIKDGVGSAGMVAGCRDSALVQVEVVDSAGQFQTTQ